MNNTEERMMDTKDRIAAKVGYGLADRFGSEQRLMERERCGKMLEEYIAKGRTDAEIVAYARALLRTDY